MRLSFLLLLFLAPHLSAHTPHDNVHALATADLANGQRMMLMSSRSHGRILRSVDNGLSWSVVHGAGLELCRVDRIVWDGHNDGQRFLIGGNRGVWAYQPLSNTVTKLDDGMGLGLKGYVTDMEAPQPGEGGPVLASTVDGYVMKLDRETDRWHVSLDTGFQDERAQLAMTTKFRNGDDPGDAQTVAAAFGGVLYLSTDFGETWTTHAQFNIPAALPTDPTITAIEFADDFIKTGKMVLATRIENLVNFSGDQGELWQSEDYGVSFNPVFQADSSFRRIVATPRGPSGEAWILAAVLEHPDFNNLGDSEGVFRSSDGGLTWSDFGNAQDFIAEKDAAWSVSADRAEVLEFSVSPTFEQDGQIYFGRTEGLFESSDEGLHWIRRPYRHVMQTRALSSFFDANGDVWVAGGTYGAGTFLQKLSDGTVQLLDAGPIPYQDDLDVSPNFAEDGTILVAGLGGKCLWFDPVLRAPNVFNKWGWVRIDGANQLGYARHASFSPHFNGLGGAGFDQTYFFSTSSWQDTNFRSPDAGGSVEFLDKMVDGSPADFLEYVTVAPTYDATTEQGRTDVYVARYDNLFRLIDTKWKPIMQLPAFIESVAVAPDFDRDDLTPGEPLIFVGLAKYPYFGIVKDRLGGALFTSYPEGLEEGSVASVVCPPDFATRKVVYIATYSDGIKKLDLHQPSPRWENVGGPWPDYFVDSMTVSVDFANDRVLLVGTNYGLMVGKDEPDQPWQLRMGRYSRDDYSPIYRFYQPNHPANPQPDRIWNWRTQNSIPLRATTELSFVGDTAVFTDTDGSYVLVTDYAKELSIKTFKGPAAGSVDVTITNYWTDELIETRTIDLDAAVWDNENLSFQFPYQPVNVRIDAQLEDSERFYLDSMTFVPN
jgi:hypothetical protein